MLGSHSNHVCRRAACYLFITPCQVANVMRVMAHNLPAGVKISRDAKECMCQAWPYDMAIP